ncbi:MAG TPA: helix-turn-helix domain-containing protein [Aldersonia sp.]
MLSDVVPRAGSDRSDPATDAGAGTEVLSWRLGVETRLADSRADDCGLFGLVATTAEAVDTTVFLLGPDGAVMKPCVRPNAPAAIPTLERLRRAAGESGSGLPAVVAVIDGAPGEFVLAAIAQDDHVFGWLVAACAAPADVENICWAIDRAVIHLRSEFVIQRRLSRVAWNARANLARQMVRSTSYDADLRACAEYLGVDLEVGRVVAFVLERGRSSGSGVDVGRLENFVAAELDVDVLSIRGTEGVVLAIAAKDAVEPATFVDLCTRAVARGLDRMGDQFAVAGLSTVTRPAQLRRAYREAFEAARCLDRYPSDSTRAVACDALGPARLLIANSNEQSVRTYVHDILGPLLVGGTANNDLLRTLQAFFDGGRSVRETATRLAVHENTVRHRLGRVHDVTGLDVATNSNDQLSVQTALVILRLQGHHAVPGFAVGAVAGPRGR